jgi:hypothetical protein
MTSALTIGLLGVAVAASYAAIVDEPPVSPTATVAAAPPPTTETTPVTPPTDDTAATDDFTTPTDSSTDSSSTSTPSTDFGTTGTDVGTGVSDTGSTSTGGTTTDDPGTDTVVKPKPETTKTTDTPTKPRQTQIDLSGSDAALYDPDNHQLAPDGGDPHAIFNTTGTGWTAKTDPSLPSMDVGVTLDLGSKGKGVGKIRFRTVTPGFTVQIYGAFTSDALPNVDDSRWAFIKSRKNVDGASDGNSKGDGEEIIKIADDTSKYKQLLLWITKAPTAGSTATVRALKLFN